jgi:hypothetical protein
MRSSNDVLKSIELLADVPTKPSGEWDVTYRSPNAFSTEGFNFERIIGRPGSVCPRLLLEQIIVMYDLDNPDFDELSDPDFFHNGLVVSEWKKSLMCILDYLFLDQGPIIQPDNSLWYPRSDNSDDAKKFKTIWEDAKEDRLGDKSIYSSDVSVPLVVGLLRTVLGERPIKIMTPALYDSVVDDIKEFSPTKQKGMACLKTYGIKIKVKDGYGKLLSGYKGGALAFSGKTSGVTRIAVGAAWVGITAFLIHRARK